MAKAKRGKIDNFRTTSKDFQKLKKERLKEVDGAIEELSKANEKEFKEGILDFLKQSSENLMTAHEEILSVMEWCGGQYKLIEKVALENFKRVNEELNTRDKVIEYLGGRIEHLEAMLCCLWVISETHFEGENLGYKRQKEIAEMFHIDWDGSMEVLRDMVLKNLASQKLDS